MKVDGALYTASNQVSQGTEIGRDDALLDVLQLLEKHRRGILPAIVTLGAREEQHLPRFSPEDHDTQTPDRLVYYWSKRFAHGTNGGRL
jgi:hypothetical protein